MKSKGNQIYSAEKINIIDIWFENYIGDSTLFIEIKRENYSNVKINVDNFGWLKSYLSDCKVNDSYDNLFDSELYIILNENNEIECFGKNKNSPRMNDILNHTIYQNGSEQSNITP